MSFEDRLLNYRVPNLSRSPAGSDGRASGDVEHFRRRRDRFDFDSADDAIGRTVEPDELHTAAEIFNENFAAARHEREKPWKRGGSNMMSVCHSPKGRRAPLRDTTVPHPKQTGEGIWLTIMAACTIAAVPFMCAGFHYASWLSLGSPVAGAICSRALMRYRETYKFGTVVDALFQMIFVSVFGVMASYAAATVNAPLVDAELLYIDQSLGYDWLAYLSFVGKNATIRQILHLAYISCFIQPPLLALILSLTNRQIKYELFILSMLLSLALTVLIFIVCPARTAWIYLGQETAASLAFAGVPVSGEDWAYVLSQIRAGGGRLVFSPVGLIAFPSFHCVMALLNIRAAWSVNWLRIPFIILNGLMIASALAVGGHYMVDLIAGSLVTVIAAILAVKIHPWVCNIRLPAARILNPEPISLFGQKGTDLRTGHTTTS